jgi:hypothetical protein
MSVYNGVLYPADPPEGIERNPDQQPEATVLTVITGITFALSTFSIITRLYGRTVLMKKFAFDDCKLTPDWVRKITLTKAAVLMLLAYICNVIMVAFVLDSPFIPSFPHRSL